MMRTILRLMNRDPDDIEHVTDRAGHDLQYAIDWYRNNESCWAPVKDAVEGKFEGRSQ